MSSQSSEGFLGESELPEQILRYLDLKLDKEAFIRPNKEVVTEIYTRFLDKTGYEWRKSKRFGQDTILLAQMLHALKIIFSHYNLDYEFTLNDIVAPVRKRTTTFLNVVLYVVAMLDEKLKHLQEWKAQYAVEQQEVDQINQEIAKRRAALEELALRIGQSLSVDQMRLEIEACERVFNEKKKECDRLEEEKCAIKKAIEEEREAIDELAKEVQQTDQRVNLQNQLEKLILEEVQLKERVASDEIVDAKRRRQAEVEVSQADRDLHRKRNEMMDFVKDAESRIKELKMEIADVRKKREDLATQRKQRENEIKEHIDKANKKLETLRARSECTRPETNNSEAVLHTYKDKLELLLGEYSMKASLATESDKNSTFIKSRGPTN